MLKKSLFNISYVSAGNVFNAILGFLFLSAVAKALTLDEFGKYALITSVLVATTKIIDFGTNSVYVSDSISKNAKLTEVFYFTKVVLLLISIPISLIILFFLQIADIGIILIFILGLIGYAINYTLFAFFQKGEMFLETILLNTLPGIFKGIIGIAVFLGYLELNFEQFFGVFSISIFISAILYIWLPQEFKIKINSLSSKGALDFIKTSWAAGAALLIRVSWGAISNSILKLAKSFTDVGIFSLANKIANIFSLISLSVFTVMLPKNAFKKKLSQNYDFREALVIGVLIIFLAIGAIVVGKVFILYVFEDKFAASLPILNILIVAYAIGSINHFLENFFFIENNTKLLLNITLVNLFFFLLFAVLLVPSYGLVGLAYTQLISSAISLAVSIYTINSRYNK